MYVTVCLSVKMTRPISDTVSRLHNRNRSAAARTFTSSEPSTDNHRATWHKTASVAWHSLAKCRNCYPHCSPRTPPPICICIAINSQCGTASAVGRFTARGRICFVDGGGFFDGPANFLTSRFPPGGDGRIGASIFRDTGMHIHPTLSRHIITYWSFILTEPISVLVTWVMKTESRRFYFYNTLVSAKLVCILLPVIDRRTRFLAPAFMLLTTASSSLMSLALDTFAIPGSQGCNS